MTIDSGVPQVTIENNMLDLGSSLSETSLDSAIFVGVAPEDYNRHPDDIVIAHNTFVSGHGALDKRLLSASKVTRICE